MSTRRAVTYGGLICLLAAWLASAASTSWQRQEPEHVREQERSAAEVSSETLAADVQAHAAKLRDRLASARSPQLPLRNPFAFQSQPTPAVRSVAPPIESVTLPPDFPPPPEPAISLIGIAEDQGPTGKTRTAIIADDTDVFMVTIGQTVLGRYRVEAISVDAVELKDVGTNAVRRLALR